ncbi:hypothetical protein [Nesterenkonia pannonica]|uniref:hypothetical protein n=1 Tax=Nesterenkonia pannonica TaxID=1548602 RepID=UPI0021647F47|nr:hypothetical protein [Nesterenkonia pannonica]
MVPLRLTVRPPRGGCGFGRGWCGDVGGEDSAFGSVHFDVSSPSAACLAHQGEPEAPAVASLGLFGAESCREYLLRSLGAHAGAGVGDTDLDETSGGARVIVSVPGNGVLPHEKLHPFPVACRFERVVDEIADDEQEVVAQASLELTSQPAQW